MTNWVVDCQIKPQIPPQSRKRQKRQKDHSSVYPREVVQPTGTHTRTAFGTLRVCHARLFPLSQVPSHPKWKRSAESTDQATRTQDKDGDAGAAQPGR